ncbi:GntR family transcriptional regulator [Actinotalea sp. Marseille-Q4924]|uniref:GntR family transcriptional regulator n=1 Tax=Actinotalea sp. Marseille-Q4924 TaxID=2866571 RepID=UPI001CE4AB20|nr:GntR family transcriptional regulator [Actinotalea sp. Marseille-Q4924]
MPTAQAGPTGPTPPAGLRLHIDPSSAVPPYEQVRREVERQATEGVLTPGARLPTVRRLAEDLGLAVNTVARAYRELEQGGVVVTRGRSGTFVAVRGEDREREVRVAATAFARRVRELEVDPDVAVRLVREALGADGR